MPSPAQFPASTDSIHVLNITRSVNARLIRGTRLVLVLAMCLALAAVFAISQLARAAHTPSHSPGKAIRLMPLIYTIPAERGAENRFTLHRNGATSNCWIV